MFQIWELADFNKKGYLDKNGAFIALKLVAACQQGHSPSRSVLSLSLDPPSFASRCATPSIPNFGSFSLADKWTITPAEQAKYDSVFDSLNPVDDKVSGSKGSLFVTQDLSIGSTSSVLGETSALELGFRWDFFGKNMGAVRS